MNTLKKICMFWEENNKCIFSLTLTWLLILLLHDTNSVPTILINKKYILHRRRAIVIYVDH